MASSAPIPQEEPRYATAFFYEPDGIWGSVVFKQTRRAGPVQIQALLNNVARPGGNSVSWSLFNEPVHYDNPAHIRCTVRTLRGVMPGGDLSKKHGLISQSHFSVIGNDFDLSLYEGDKGYIVQRTLSIGDTACATVYALRGDVVVPGMVPCEVHTWSDCVVSVGSGRCIRQTCRGLQRFWGVEKNDFKLSAVKKGTKLCVQKYEMIPMVVDEKVAEDGTIGCSLSRSAIMGEM